MTWSSARKCPNVSLTDDVIPIGQPEGAEGGNAAWNPLRKPINSIIFFDLRDVNPASMISTLRDQ